MAIIEYTPWTEDKEEAKKQLAEYVQTHPKAGFMFDSNTPRPDTTYLLNGDEPVAEIFTVFIKEAAEDNENIGEEFSYRDVLNNTLKHNPEFSKLKTEDIDETVSIIEKIKDYTDNHKKLVRIGSVIIIFFAVFGLNSMLMNKIFGNSNDAGIIKSEHRFYASQGYMVGKFIAKNIPNAKVLLIENENFKKSKYEQALITALKEGMGNNNVNVVALKILNSDSEMAPSAATSKDFNAVIGSNSSTNVIVSTIGLPRDNGKMKLWKMPKAKRPELILINSSINDLIKLSPAVKKGMVSAVVIINPKAKLVTEDSPSKLEDAFKKRYILVDKNNLAENEKS
jgi:hypothetical protein